MCVSGVCGGYCVCEWCVEGTVCVSGVYLKVTLRIKQIGVTRDGAQAVHTTNSHGCNVDAVHTTAVEASTLEERQCASAPLTALIKQSQSAN